MDDDGDDDVSLYIYVYLEDYLIYLFLTTLFILHFR